MGDEQHETVAIKCPKCGNDIRIKEGMKYCSKCGMELSNVKRDKPFEANRIKCPNCGSDIRIEEGTKYCSKCGMELSDFKRDKPFEAARIKCPNCGTDVTIKEGTKYCLKCGVELSRAKRDESVLGKKTSQKATKENAESVAPFSPEDESFKEFTIFNDSQMEEFASVGSTFQSGRFITWVVTLVLGIFLTIMCSNDADNPVIFWIIAVSSIGLGAFGCYHELKKIDGKSKNSSRIVKGVIKGIVIAGILLGVVYLGVSCVVGLQDDTTFHYLDTNGNDKADPGEYRWTEDGDGNETPGW